MGDAENYGDGGDYPSQSRIGIEIQGQTGFVQLKNNLPLQRQPLMSTGVQDWTSQE